MSDPAQTRELIRQHLMQRMPAPTSTLWSEGMAQHLEDVSGLDPRDPETTRWALAFQEYVEACEWFQIARDCRTPREGERPRATRVREAIAADTRALAHLQEVIRLLGLDKMSIDAGLGHEEVREIVSRDVQTFAGLFTPEQAQGMIAALQQRVQPVEITDMGALELLGDS